MRSDLLRDERGNTLVLMPIAVVIVLGLAGISVDMALGFRAQRELEDLAAGIANDAVTAIDLDAFYGVSGTPELVLDERRIQTIVDSTVAAQPAGDPLSPNCTWTITGGGSTPPSLDVTCLGTADVIFFGAFGRDTIPVGATASATLEQD